MTTGRFAIVMAMAATLVPGVGLAQYVELPPGTAARRLPSHLYERVRQDPTAMFGLGGWAARVERSVAARQAVEGDLPIVAVPALFSDSPDPSISDADLRASLFTGPESLRAFYAEASGDRLNIAGDVTPWVRTSLTRDYVVGSEYGLGDDSGDDNGFVDAIAFYFVEVAASCGGPGIWPHFWGLSSATGSSFATDDLRPNGQPIIIDAYFIQSIVNCSGTAIAPMTTIAHEAGHMLGLPDLYDRAEGLLPEERRWVVGCWSLMAAGAWGCGPVNEGRIAWVRPTHPGAWEKKRLGWLDEITVVSDEEILDITLAPVQTARTILELPMGDDERLLIEYRDTIGFDRDLPAAGVLIYTINDTLPSRRPNPESPLLYRIMLREADDDSSLTQNLAEGGSRGEPGDAFAALGPGALTSLTEPSSRDNSGRGQETDINIYRITLEDGAARLILSTAPISSLRLLGPLLLDEANYLTEPEEDYLDRLNNGNGRYDVGDLRAYLLRDTGGPAPN
jgi:M6 family metalloprotease-like protein